MGERCRNNAKASQARTAKTSNLAKNRVQHGGNAMSLVRRVFTISGFLALFSLVGISGGFSQQPTLVSLPSSERQKEATSSTIGNQVLKELPAKGQAPSHTKQPEASIPENVITPPVLKNFGTLPLSFEENQGQVDGQVKYLARGKGYTLFLTETEAVLALGSATRETLEVRSEEQEDETGEGRRVEEQKSEKGEGRSGKEESEAFGVKREGANLSLPFVRGLNSEEGLNGGVEGRDNQPSPTSVVRMTFAGANQTPTVNGADQLPGIVNYFIGNDPDHWHTKIPTYKKVQYDNLYDGIDLVYYGNQGQLEYDLVVEPGADPSQIQLAFEGTDTLKVNEAGDLVLTVEGSSEKLEVRSKGQEGDGTDRGTASDPNLTRLTPHASPLTSSSTLRLLKPHVYQLIDGHKVEIAANYVMQSDPSHVSLLPSPLTASAAVAIQLAAYDTTQPLIIDPVLHFSTYLGGSGIDEGFGVAVDGAGAAYVSGDTASIDFPTLNAGQGASGGGLDAFVTKLDAAGTRVYSTYLGGSGNDRALSIAVDGAGAAYVSGDTASIDFPTLNAGQGASGGGLDAFVTRLDAAGAHVYSTYLGGGGSDQGINVVVDGAGAAYVSGQTDSTDFPTLNASQGANGGGLDAFVTKLGVAGAHVYSTYLGGSGTDQGFGVGVDGAGAAYVSGRTDSTDFPTLNASQGANGGGNDAFVTKLDGAGAHVYSTYLGGSGNDQAHGVAVDRTGAAVVTGWAASTDFPTLNATQGVSSGNGDGFVTKLDGAGAHVYSTYLGGSGGDQGQRVAVDKAGAAYVSGDTASIDFPTLNATQGANGGGNDAFVTKLDGAGAHVYSTYLGGSGNDQGIGVGVDGAGAAYVSGPTDSTDFPTLNASQGTLGGGTNDAFVVKICNDPPTGTTPGMWQTTGSMNLARNYLWPESGPVALPDGRVLVAGGLFNPTNTAEIFDSTTGAFTNLVETMNVPRRNHSATLLSDGKVLLVGGRSVPSGSPNEATAELFDPETENFTFTTGFMAAPRRFHSATLLADGRVLIAGGLDVNANTLATAELYDPATQTFSPTTNTMSEARFVHTATLLADGRVLIAGGGGVTNDDVHASAEIFDPATNTFTPTAGLMTQARRDHAATLLADGRVLITAGVIGPSAGFLSLASAEIFDPTSGTFSPTDSLSFPRFSHDSVRLADGRVLIVGGIDFFDLNDFNNNEVLTAVELYNPDTGAFSLTGSLSVGRTDFSAVSLANGQVLVVGGTIEKTFTQTQTLETPTSTAELYTPNICGPEADIAMVVDEVQDPVAVGVGGSPLQYNIDLTNNGPDDAAQVEFTLTVPEGATFDSATGATCSEAGGVVSCSVGPLANSTTVMPAVIFLTNTATPGIESSDIEVQLVGEFDPDFGNNAETETTIFQSSNPETDLVLTITDTPDPVALSPGTYSYTLNVDNMGTDVAIATVVAADIPEGVTLDSTSFPGGTCVPDAGVGPLTTGCTIGDLDVLTGTQVVLNVTATTEGMKTLTVNANSTGPNAVPDADSTNNTDIAETTLVAGAGQHIFVVDSNLDTGEANPGDGVCQAAPGGFCTLRAALEEANALPNDPAGPDIIAFNIAPGGVQSIAVGSVTTTALPDITDPVVIDGTTQPGFAGAPIIELDGTNANTGASQRGLTLFTGNSTIRGLVINRFGSGITIAGAAATNNRIEGNYIGLGADGLTALGNGIGGIVIESGASQNTIGGTVPGTRNVISGHRNPSSSGGPFNGILMRDLSVTMNTILGNFVGTDATGLVAVPNDRGITLATVGVNNRIGGSTAAARNVIAGNVGIGLELASASATVVEGNFIGTNANGTGALPNTEGIRIIGDTTGTTIGGTTGVTPGSSCTGACNLISGNSGRGVGLAAASGGNNFVQGNFIGPDVTGLQLLATTDGQDGLEVFDGSNIIGGAVPEARNVISGNVGFGVRIRGTAATGNQVSGNYIGTDTTGGNALPNAAPGVQIIESASGNMIGGTIGTTPDGPCTGACNVISGNGDGTSSSDQGIHILNSAGNVVQGNMIGLDVTGTIPVPNTNGGVWLDNSPTTIGGTIPQARNVISGNGGNGVLVRTDPLGSTISGNYIGTNASGTAALSNGGHGILLNGASGNTVGGLTGTTPDGPCTGACNVISGHTVISQGTGIQIEGFTTTDNFVIGNFIGTDATGLAAIPNQIGITLTNGGPGNQIGGTTAEARNVISGNATAGLTIRQSDATVVEGNFIGTKTNGTEPLPNFNGVLVDSETANARIGGTTDVTVGGPCTGSCNLISGNTERGIFVTDTNGAAHDTVIQGNYIGPDVSGMGSLASTSRFGIELIQTHDNLVGGTTLEARNVIAGLTGTGVRIRGAIATGNHIEGNFIGLAANGSALGNVRQGLDLILDAAGNFIGPGNTIAFNGQEGVLAIGTAGVGNAIQQNMIHSNSLLGIDLSANTSVGDGPTPNDPQDVDGSPNNLQNYPVLETATRVSGGTRVVGTFNSTPDRSFTIEFFSNAVCDPSGFGEGETFVDAVPATPAVPDALAVTTDSNGDATISATIDAILPGRWLTATATDTTTNDTSEFSQCVSVKAEDRIYGTHGADADGDPGLPVHLISFVPDDSNPPTSADLQDHGPIQVEVSEGVFADTFVDALALSHTHGLVGFEGEGAPGALTGMRLVRLDPITAQVTPIDQTFEPTFKGIHGAVFDRDEQLWVVDIDTDELLRVETDPLNPLVGQEVAGSRVGLTVGGTPVDLTPAVDLAIREDGTLYLVHINEVYTVDPAADPVSGTMVLVFTDTQNDNEVGIPPGHTGATFSALASSDRLMTMDSNDLDDVFVYDIDTNFARTEFLEDVLPTVNTGLSDLAAFTPRLVEITIDATALTAPTFGIKDADTVGPASIIQNDLDTTTPQSLSLPPGTYGFCQVACGNNSFVFTVQPDGTMTYAAGLDTSQGGYLSGQGTSTLVAEGVTFFVDTATGQLSMSTFGLRSFDNGAGAILNFEPTAVDTAVTVIPGTLGFCEMVCGGGTFNFTVDNEGMVGYDPAFDAWLEGRDTNTLQVLGVTIEIDATAISAPTFGFRSRSSGIIANAEDKTVVQTYQVVPHQNPDPLVASHFFCEGACGTNSFGLKVGVDGVVTHHPDFDAWLDVQNGNRLVVIGVPITIEAPTLSAGTFGIATEGSVIGNGFSGSTTLTLVPREGDESILALHRHVFCEGACGAASFRFMLTTDGVLAYDAALGGFLEGSGTTTLTVNGYNIQIDATALTAPTFGVRLINGLVIGTPWDASVVQTFTLLPSTSFASHVFCETSCGPETFQFSVTNAGTVDYAPAVGAHVSGRGTDTLVVRDAVSVGLVLTVNSTSDVLGANTDVNLGDGVCFTGTILPNGEEECTLFAALQEANHPNNAGLDLIAFAIDNTNFPLVNGAHTIRPSGPLPGIIDSVIIDGTTEPDFAGTPMVELDGTNAGAGTQGLAISAGSSTVRGLVINRFGNIGIHIATTNASGNVIAGNYIGTDVTGTMSDPTPGSPNSGDEFGNGLDGIRITFSSDNQIGGTTSVDRNIISGNLGLGVNITNPSSSNNRVQGNYIGTDVTGMNALSNSPNGGGGGVGIVNAPNNLIGGTAPGAGNVISGNGLLTTGTGVAINFPDSTGNRVEGNIIGLNVNGTEPLGNHAGVTIKSASGNTIGGTTPEARNIISGNSSAQGIYILTINDAEGETFGNTVQGNYIGTDITGTVAIPNAEGVRIGNARDNLIGGTTPGAGNVISGNTGHGIIMSSCTGCPTTAPTAGNEIQGNHIGVNATGTAILPNTSGIFLVGASHTTIGGTIPGARNIISANGPASIGGDGIRIAFGSTDSVVQGNYIGTDVTGTIVDPDGIPGNGNEFGNAIVGIRLDGVGTNRNLIGGVVAGARNLISGNAFGGIVIEKEATQNTVQGNFIGTDVTGLSDLGNIQDGVVISASASNNTIGGNLPFPRTTCVAPCNLISGNERSGVVLQTEGTQENILKGNYIGVDVTGVGLLSNSVIGIIVADADENMIGGPTLGDGNVVAGNGAPTGNDQISIRGNAESNVLQGNFIGVGANGQTSFLPAFTGIGNGIAIPDGAHDNQIGGTEPNEGNLIRFNPGFGIRMFDPAGSGNSVLGNRIFENFGLGIHLGSTGGVIPNDFQDPDSGANNRQNFPVSDVAMSSPSGTTIEGTLNSTPNHTFRVEFFGNQVCDASGNGEGETVLGTTQVVTDPNGDGAFSVTVPGVVPVDQFVTATATDEITNDTSEFSACAQVTASAVVIVNNTDDGDDGTCNATHCSLREAIHAANAAPQPTTIHFNLTGTAPFTIQPEAVNGPLPALTTPIILDGTSQSDYVDRPVIEVEGSLLAGTLSNGLVISGSNSLVRGLAITNFPLAGIRIEGGQENTVVGNYLGTDVNGTLAKPNGQQGLLLTNGAQGNVIGGTVGITPGGACTDDCNLISGNTGSGVEVSVAATGNTIHGNMIGLARNGAARLSNGGDGVWLNNVPANLVGGTTVGMGNVISGNTLIGVRISGASATTNIVQGNLVGLNAAGDAIDADGTFGNGNEFGNGEDGILIHLGASNNCLGGTPSAGTCTAPFAGNTVSGNGAVQTFGDGIQISGATNNWIQGNRVGTDITGAVALGQRPTRGGITLELAVGNVIGGTEGVTPLGPCTGACNLISGHNASGIHLLPGSHNTIIQGNYVGTDHTGLLPLGNDFEGIQVAESQGVLIGGNSPEARNIVSANGAAAANPGITLFGVATHTTRIQGNFIGTDVQGVTDLGNIGVGIFILGGSHDNIVGGSNSGEGNLISGNDSHGIVVNGAGTNTNTIQGNYIGTDVTGTVDRGNAGDGVLVIGGAQGNTIGGTAGTTPGGTCTGACNVISGNDNDGVDLFGAGTNGNVIQGNYIGTDVSGTVDLGNGKEGVLIIEGAQGNVIGGSVPQARNVISRNAVNGVQISGSGSDLNTIQGNYIGTDVSGTLDLGNDISGVAIEGGGTNNTVGGTVGGAGNLIAFNRSLGGVRVGSGTGNRILGNAIFSNIDVGITLNAGANNDQNAPANLIVESSSSGTTVAGALDTVAGNFRLEFFANASCDASGSGEGQTFLGATTVTHGGSGLESFSAPLASEVPVGQIVTATATNLGTNDTSEFSPCATVMAFVQSGATEVINTNPNGDGSLAEAINVANSTTEADVITFNIPGAGPHVIQPVGSLVITAPVILDGYTQPGASPNTLSVGSNANIQIVVDGTNALAGTSGIYLRASNSTVRGLAVTNWGANGIRIEPDTGGQADNNTIVGNYVGTDATGLIDEGNSSDGVQIISSTGNTVGGLTPADRNVISGNSGDGIDLQASTDTLIVGNYIGVDATGEGPLGNDTAGVFINLSADNTIGGATVAARNIIAANAGEGVYLNGASTNDNVVEGNYIGLTASGGILGNTAIGIRFNNNANQNTIGGTAVAAGNVISGNNTGITVQADNNVVQGNLIGLDPTGTFTDPTPGSPASGDEYGNTSTGISVLDGSNNCIGGSRPAVLGDPCVAPFAGNVIAGNGTEITFAEGIQISTFNGISEHNSIQGNYIGTDVTGTVALGQAPGRQGINLSEDVSTYIGGTEGTTPHIDGIQAGACTGACNLIAGHRNAHGIELRDGSDGAIIQGNYIGTDITGTISDPNGVPEDGDEFGNGGNGIVLRLSSTNVLIGGTVPEARNVIAGNQVGINVQDFSNAVTIHGNYVGTDTTGTQALPNSVGGVTVAANATNVQVGGTENVQPDVGCLGACNLLSGNGVLLSDQTFPGSANGVRVVTGGQATIQGNFIGTDVTGTQALPNTHSGVRLQSGGNLVGGTDPLARNLIAGNDHALTDPPGILVLETDDTTRQAVGNQLLGNYIGTNAAGEAALPNGGQGILLLGGSETAIGGLSVGAGNLIAGNGAEGIVLQPSSVVPQASVDNVIEGNRIGLAADGVTPLPNGGAAGISLGDTDTTQVGPANVVAFNSGHGVQVIHVGSVPGVATTGNTILSNQIYDNVGLGLQLAGGANADQAAPVLDVVLSDGAGTTVSGTASGPAGETVTVELYANTVCNGDAPTNFGEGERVLGTTPVALDGTTGQGSFVVSLPGAPGQPEITATATDAAGNTSAFSACVTARGNQAPTAAEQTAPAELEDTPQLLTLSGTDPDSATLTFAIDTSPSQGSLSELGVPDCTAQGQGTSCTASVTYTPAPEAFGPDHFTFTVSDGTEGSAPASVELTVTAVPEPPVATGDTVHVLTIPAGSPTQATPVAVLGNDHDPDGDPLTVTAVTDGTNGTVAVVTGGGAVTYSPTPGFPGPGDTFTYTISDGTATATATVVVVYESSTARLTVDRGGVGTGTVTSATGAIACGSTCAADIPVNQLVLLTAAADAGSVFAGWSGSGIDCPGLTPTCQVVVDAAKTVTATFGNDVVFLAVRPDEGSGVGTVVDTTPGGLISCGEDCNAQPPRGTAVVLEATAAGGSEFAGWSGGGCSGTGVCEVTLDTTVTDIVATFHLMGIVDSDGDGIPDADEARLQTDPHSADTDGDGILDGPDTCKSTPNGAEDAVGQGDEDFDSRDGLFNLGDACDEDADNDGWVDKVAQARDPMTPFLQLFTRVAPPLGDNCPLANNVDQADLDGDTRGNDCDEDADADSFVNHAFGGLDCNDFDATVVPGTVACGATEKPPKKNKNPPPDPELTDTDGDGLTDAEEGVIGTLPDNPDTDGDQVVDGSDNCPLNANGVTNWTDIHGGQQSATQPDRDLDGVGDMCDTDEDADGVPDKDRLSATVYVPKPVSEGGDNCPALPNTDQANLDSGTGDEQGDVCDPDADADGVVGVGKPGATGDPEIDDCEDLNALINPTRDEVQYNGVDDDCDEATPDSEFSIVVELEDPADGNATLADWLPTDGRQAILTATVVDDQGPLPQQPAVEFDLVSVSQYPGRYTNDESEGLNPTNPAEDYAYDLAGGGNQATLTAQDYGATITLQLDTVVDVGGVMVTVSRLVTVPADRDGDLLPDVWEDAFGDLETSQDTDMTPGNPFDGDGLSAHKEYRGFMWGLLAPPEPGSPEADLYNTPALVPTPPLVQFFRGSPARKELFIEYAGFEPELPCACPFAIGTGFVNAGIDVYALPVGHAPDPGRRNLDVGQILNDQVNTHDEQDGHINKTGVRAQSFDTKGWSGVGDGEVYGGDTTHFQIPLDFYFADRMYVDANGNGVLDPLEAVEDKNDNNRIDIIDFNTGETEDSNSNQVLDGDTVILDSYTHEVTTMDIDDDGAVELPAVPSPAAIDPQLEQSKAAVLKHTVTHELGHMAGATHTGDMTDVMHTYSRNWVRDHHFGTSVAALKIHNTPTNAAEP